MPLNRDEVERLKGILRQEIKLLDSVPSAKRTPEMSIVRNAIVRGWFIQQRAKGRKDKPIDIEEWVRMSEISSKDSLITGAARADAHGFFRNDDRFDTRVEQYAFTAEAMEAIEEVINEPQLGYCLNATLPGSQQVTGFRLIEQLHKYVDSDRLDITIANSLVSIFRDLQSTPLPNIPNLSILNGPDEAWDMLLQVVPNQGMLSADVFNAALVKMYPYLDRDIQIEGRTARAKKALIVYPDVDKGQITQIESDSRIFGISAFAILRFLNLLETEIVPENRTKGAQLFFDLFVSGASLNLDYGPAFAINEWKKKL